MGRYLNLIFQIGTAKIGVCLEDVQLKDQKLYGTIKKDEIKMIDVKFP
tara:strand:- start:1077 stop:1220 length:144 start_codon:yes stop_codon:yes gene_type:complete